MTTQIGQLQTKTQKQIKSRFSKQSKKRFARYGIFAANVVMLIGVLAFVLRSPSVGPSQAANSLSSPDSTQATGALDSLSSADIAVNVAMMANMPEATSVANKADTVNAQLAVTAADDTVVAKPQVVATALKSYKDIQEYVTKKGDTIPKIAAKFNVTSDTIRWSNGLQGDNVKPGKTLLIPPVNGVAYVVKSGDTVKSIAAKFTASKEQVIADNDLEATSNLRVGRILLIRDGAVAATPVARVASASAGFSWGGGGAVYGFNGYDYGYCTWYVANRRAAAGNPIPSNLGNASTWKALALRAGFSVGTVPQAGAVIWTPPRDYYGHVGYVEKVYSDGSVLVSEMNTKGWAVRSTRKLTAAEAARFSYIY